MNDENEKWKWTIKMNHGNEQWEWSMIMNTDNENEWFIGALLRIGWWPLNSMYVNTILQFCPLCDPCTL